MIALTKFVSTGLRAGLLEFISHVFWAASLRALLKKKESIRLIAFREFLSRLAAKYLVMEDSSHAVDLLNI